MLFGQPLAPFEILALSIWAGCVVALAVYSMGLGALKLWEGVK